MINGFIDNSPVRIVKGKVELFDGSTLLDTYTHRDRLISFKIERIGDNSKFFGFGICQKINIKLIDKERALDITTAHSFKAYLTTGNEYVTPFPIFYVTEVHRDENTNELSITAYDVLNRANTQTCVIDAESMEAAPEPYAPHRYAFFMAQQLGFKIKINLDGTITQPVRYQGLSEKAECLTTNCPNGANLDGTETIREVLDAIANTIQAIYYIGYDNKLVFRRLDRDGAADLTINKADYIKLDSKTNRRLVAICSTTELGDNVEARLDVSGTTQYVRDNPFWDLRDNIGELVENALENIGGITINQFECAWRGNYLLEIGDKINLVTKDDEVVTSYLLNDSVEYNGFLSQNSAWSYENETEEAAANPSNLGEALKQTFARVDKANKRIELLASYTEANTKSISALQIDTGSIAASVTKLQDNVTQSIDGLSGDIATLSNSVEAKMTDEDVTIKINEALSNGVDKVETSTGFKFDETGLEISKSDSEMSTTITEDGMQVFKDNEAVLTANNQGVNAVNLHATTYLIIGTNSRFEDYGERTGCFWIGGGES